MPITTTLVKIQYVGRKPFAIDNVAGSGVVWNGNGDIQEVSDRAARVLVKYPDQWALVNAEDAPIIEQPEQFQARDDTGELVTITENDLKRPIERMTKAELVTLAKVRWGKDLDIEQTKKVLMDQVDELMRENGEVV